MKSIFSTANRSNHSEKLSTESEFQFIDRCAHPKMKAVRKRMDHLINLYPSNERDALISRIRSSDTHQFESATFELLLNFFLLRNNCKDIEIDPKLDDGRTPDFLATSVSGKKFFLEAAVSNGQSAAKSAGETRMRDFVAGLNKLNSPRFHLKLRTPDLPDVQISASKIHASVQP